MSQYKIVACDLDGTLLNGQMEITEENWEAIRRLCEMGVLFVPSSGRSLNDIPRELRESPYVRFIIHSVGSAIYDKEAGRSVRFAMSQSEAAALMDVLSDYETDRILLCDGSSYMDKTTNTPEYHNYHRMNQICQEFINENYVMVENFESFWRSLESVDMVCPFFHSDEEREACAERLSRMGYQVASSAPYNLEITHRSAGKGNALRYLAESLKIDPAATIAVGDSPNDMDMIRKAGLGLAVANAEDSLKSIASAVICSNTDGVMPYILKEYFL